MAGRSSQMIEQKTLSSDQVRYAIDNNEFPGDVLSPSELVVIVMTQDWCPQWKDMRSWIYTLQTERTVYIHEIVYNKEDYYQDFLRLKESKWNNNQIPYLRYYKNGVLYLETNYVNSKTFVHNCSL
jgi:hypothetical protein